MNAPRTCLITGPTSGLGRGIALALAKRGFRLALLGRNADKLRQLARECVALGAPEPLLLICDMASQQQVRRAAAEFLASGWPLHVLINNAGLMNLHRRMTEDHLEESSAVGYFSMFLLTLLLAGRMKDSAPATVINTTSDTYPIGKIPFDDIRFERRYGPIYSYAASKLAVVIFTRMLAERLKPHGVSANVYTPGMIYTGLAVTNNEGWLVRLGDFFWRRIAGPVAEGIAIPLQLATAPHPERTTGQLYWRGTLAAIKPRATDPLTGNALWEHSETLTGASLPASFASPSQTTVDVACRPVRLGVLGAARIAPYAVFKHVDAVRDIEVRAVAEEHQSFGMLVNYARRHGIAGVYRSFDRLLADPAIDAVYIPLPISLHERWTLAAIAAGKHVLCEKPLAANAMQAERIRAAAQNSGLVVAEAMHFRHHPLADRVRQIIGSGEIGQIRQVDASFSAWLPADNFRFNYALGGGCTIDMGCYPIAFIRAVLGTEPGVRNARAHLAAPEIDGWMKAELDFPGDIRATLFMGMHAWHRPLSVRMRFVGDAGRIDILNFIKPEVFHRLTVRSRDGHRVERVSGGSTYRAQLAAFVAAIREGKPIPTSPADAVATLRVIDDIYEKAGLRPRGNP